MCVEQNSKSYFFFASRDVPGVEVLMEQHQNRKVEIDAREDSFDDVVKMGKDLIARNHYATPEVGNYYFLRFLSFITSEELMVRFSTIIAERRGLL